MSYSNTYVAVIARTIDIMLAGWIWRDYGVTISSWAGLEMRKARPRRWARVVSRVLDRIEPGHCEAAIAADIMRAYDALDILGAGFSHRATSMPAPLAGDHVTVDFRLYARCFTIYFTEPKTGEGNAKT